jgi:hypothetical protein
MDKSEVYPLFMISIFLFFYALLVTSALSMVPLNQANPAMPNIVNYEPNFNNTYYEVTDDYANNFDGEKYYTITSNEDYYAFKFSISGSYDLRIIIDTDDVYYYMWFTKIKEGAWLDTDVISHEYDKHEISDMFPHADTDQFTFKFYVEKVLDITISVPVGSVQDGFALNEYTITCS